MELSSCGLICDECEFFNTTCAGCYNVKGSTFWAVEMVPSGVCPLFDCAINKKELKSCGQCDELPCKMFREMKDPNISEEEHQRLLITRVERLREA